MMDPNKFVTSSFKSQQPLKRCLQILQRYYYATAKKLPVNTTRQGIAICLGRFLSSFCFFLIFFFHETGHFFFMYFPTRNHPSFRRFNFIFFWFGQEMPFSWAFSTFPFYIYYIFISTHQNLNGKRRNKNAPWIHRWMSRMSGSKSSRLDGFLQ